MKTFLIVFAVLILAAVSYYLFIIKGREEEFAENFIPKIEKMNMSLLNLTSEKADMKVNMVINNPAPVGIHIDSLYYTVSIDGTEVIKTTYPDPVDIESGSQSEIDLPISLKFDNLKEIQDRKESEGSDSGNYHLAATIFLNNKLIPKKKFDLEFDKVLPMIWFPEINIEGVDVNKLKLSGGTLDTQIKITNKNVFDLSFKNLSYQIKVEDNEWMKGEKSDPVIIPAKDSVTASIPVELDLGQTGESLIDLLLKGDDLRYEFRMSSELVSTNDIIENSNIQMNSSGTLGSLKKAVK